MTDQILTIAKGDKGFIGIRPDMANRHGLIAGATGTGKTVTLRVLAEQFSSIGVPVFMADVKGDLGGIFTPGGDHDKVAERVDVLGLSDFSYQGFPITFWDVFREKGHPVRTTISEMGPLILSRLLNLNEVQSGLISLAFRIADDEGLLLLDFPDLRSMVTYLGENAKEFRMEYGNISSASIGAIQRSLLALEEQGADFLFGEPALDIFDFMQTDQQGRGMINILSAEKLMLSPKIYSTFLLWLLSELFENLPEVGDPEKPKLVFFFDEAHLLFDDAPKALKEKIEQVVRLIRSKGVGVYFITQNPTDLPDNVLGQLGNRVQHALRAFTPKDQKAVRAAAQTFRINPDLDVEQAITQLDVGEGLVSVLDEDGAPTIVERALICPPMSRLGTITPQERSQVMNNSLVRGVYDQDKDPESAHEILVERRKKIEKERIEAEEREEREKEERRNRPRRSNRQSLLEAITKSTLRSVGSSIGRRIARGILGGLLGK